MKAYQVMGVIVACTGVFTGVVFLLTMNGVHLLLAVLGVYLVAVSTMLSMQRRARENFELLHETGRCHRDGYSSRRRTGTMVFSETREF